MPVCGCKVWGKDRDGEAQFLCEVSEMTMEIE